MPENSTKILMINDFCDVPGGAEKQMYREVDLLEGSGLETVTVGFRRPEECREAISDHVLEETSKRTIRIIQKITVQPDIYFGLKKIIREECPDIIHIHKNQNYPISVLLSCRGKPVIKTHHDFTTVCPSGWAVYQDNKKVCPGGPGIKCIRHGCKSVPEMGLYHSPRYITKVPLQKRIIDQNIAPSQALTEYLTRFGFDTKQVPYPRFKVAKEPIIREKNQNFLFAGRLQAEKGVDVLLQAVSNLPKERLSNNEGPFVRIAGDGSMRDELEMMAKNLGISQYVEFLGYVEHANLIEMYKTSRGVIVPSIWMENFPNTVIEALSLGCPVIGSSRGGIPELLGEGDRGLIFDPGSPKELSERMIALLDDPRLAEKMGEKSIQYTTKELSEERICQLHLSIINNLI